MSSIDRFKMLAGLPILMSDNLCLIYPASLIEIAKLNVETYFRYVNLLTLDSKEVKRIIGEELTPFNFLFMNSLYKEEFKNLFIEALEFFTKEKVLFLDELETIAFGNFEESRLLTEDNFSEFQSIIKAQNFIEEDVVKFTGENEAAKHIKSRLEKGRQTVERIKRKKESGTIELADLVGSLSINSTINIVDVWNISYYTFNDQFKRMRLLEQYDTGLRSIMAGADPKKIKLQDWIRNIQ